MSEIKIKFFGMIAEIVNADEIMMNDIYNTDELLQKLYIQYPALKNMKFAISLDRQIIHQNTAVHANSELAILPPFSGG